MDSFFYTYIYCNGENMVEKCKVLLCELIVLVCVGLFTIYTSSNVWASYSFDDAFFYFKRQCIFACVGFVMFFLCSKVKLSKLKKYNKTLFLLGIVCLILVLIPGIGVSRNGSRSWFQISSFLIQPSEFYKIILIMNVSEYVSNKKKLKKIKDFIIPIIWMGFSFLLILLQPDFGSGMVVVCSVIIVFFCANIPFKYFIYLFLIGVLGLSGLIISAPYRLERIVSYLDPWKDPLGSGFQIIQSLYAIAPGGLFGVGIGNSMQKQFYLPEPQTDFIFAIFSEEFGFLGCLLLLLLYFLIIYEGIRIALLAQNKYECYVCIGIVSLFAIQTLINIGVVIGLFPVTGITLPLFSYGGSSLVVTLSMFGLLYGVECKKG